MSAGWARPLPRRAANHVLARDYRFGSCVNGRFRDQSLSVEWFRDCSDAQVILEASRKQCSAMRLRASLHQLTPHELKQHHLPFHVRQTLRQVWNFLPT